MIPVLVSLVLHGALILLSAAAGAVALRRVAGGPAVAVGGGVVAAGVIAYGVGIVWFAAPQIGIWVSRAVPVACLTYLAIAWRRDRATVAPALRPLLVPAALTGLWAAVTLGAGFLYGGYDNAAGVAAVRFSWQLPIDNQLPFIFARQVELAGHVGPPVHVGDWLSSDRPPLQSAFVLSGTVRHLSDADALLDYQVLSTLLQSTWVVGVWMLSGVLTSRRSVRALMVGGVAACGQVLLNSFFVWPKLLAATFTIVALAFVLCRHRMCQTRRFSLAAAASALAYLSHGGVVFALLPVVVLAGWQALRGRRRVRTVGAALGVGAALVTPWVLYQRLYDPPGDRLVKWMLADVRDVDPRPALAAIVEQYRAVGIGGAVRYKLDNLGQVIGIPAPAPIPDGLTMDALVGWVRVISFYSLLPSFGLLLLLALGWLWRARADQASLQQLRVLAWVWLAGVLSWCVLMFGPGTTFTHQGTYAFVVVGAVLLVGSGALASVRVTAVVVLTQAALTFAVYLPMRPVADIPWTHSAEVARQALLVLAVASIAMVSVLVAYARASWWTSRLLRAGGGRVLRSQADPIHRGDT